MTQPCPRPLVGTALLFDVDVELPDPDPVPVAAEPEPLPVSVVNPGPLEVFPDPDLVAAVALPGNPKIVSVQALDFINYQSTDL
jgi:hypothetical protein